MENAYRKFVDLPSYKMVMFYIVMLNYQRVYIYMYAYKYTVVVHGDYIKPRTYTNTTTLETQKWVTGWVMNHEYAAKKNLIHSKFRDFRSCRNAHPRVPPLYPPTKRGLSNTLW